MLDGWNARDNSIPYLRKTSKVNLIGDGEIMRRQRRGTGEEKLFTAWDKRWGAHEELLVRRDMSTPSIPQVREREKEREEKTFMLPD